MDNFVMIQAGDMIDSTIGVKFGMATLTAAAFGQIFSDVSGVMFGGVVDAVAARLGLPPVTLTPAQRQSALCKRVSTAGSICGVIAGCLLGMTSLLFMDLEKTNAEKRKNELCDTLTDVMTSTMDALRADSFILYTVENPSSVGKSSERFLKACVYSSTNDDWRPSAPLNLARSVVGRVMGDADMLNIGNIGEDKRWNEALEFEVYRNPHSILSHSVRDKKGQVLAVLQFAKTSSDEPESSFSGQDEQFLRMVGKTLLSFYRSML